MFFITKARKIENTKGVFADGRANSTFGFLLRVFVIDFEWFLNRTRWENWNPGVVHDIPSTCNSYSRIRNQL